MYTTELQRINSVSIIEPDLYYNDLPEWKQLLNDMPWITLDQLQEYSLMRRFDTKYLVPEKQLLQILSKITSSYSVLKVNGMRLTPYQTTYYDTSDFLFFRQHHNGIRKRCKVRTRTYLSTDDSFLEIKQKGTNNQCVKERIQIGTQVLMQEKHTNQFIDQHCPVSEDQLEAKLDNRFMRFTLVNHTCVERVTIDLGLSLFNDRKKVMLPGVAVVEVKQARFHDNTPIVEALHDAHLHPQGFSKYCIGVSLLETQVKHNRFKKNLLQLDKMVTKGQYYYGIS